MFNLLEIFMKNISNSAVMNTKLDASTRIEESDSKTVFKNPTNVEIYATKREDKISKNNDEELIDSNECSQINSTNPTIEELGNILYQAKKSQYHLDKDVILSLITKNELEESLTKIQFHKIIYDDWGFGEVDKLGRSSILNFYGHPGTGKTLTAEAFAGRLGLPIIKLGIAEIESKLMGETSKNIQQAFADAYAQGAVLFFDEADTLLGKRLSSVTQGVDNEVNAMRSTMLIELEKFDGIVIFATNFAKNYDEAFRSRISYHVEFTLPDLDTRKKLWSRMLVEKIPLAEDREELLDKCSIESEGFSGREIRTCMRLALPKALREANENHTEAKLGFDHLFAAIENVRKAQKEVGSNVDASVNRQRAVENVNLARKMLGVNKGNSSDLQESDVVSNKAAVI